MRFSAYDADELDTCGREVVAALNGASIDEADTERWTEFVLDLFAATAGPEILVDARNPRSDATRATRGEFLVDLTHSTYPKYPPSGAHGYWSQEYWDEALKRPCRVRLALESEWGKQSSPGATRVAVLQDAVKVAAFRADAKVVVFGPKDRTKGAELVTDLARLRTASGDPAPWLLVALPWDGGKAWYEVLRSPAFARG